MRFIFYFLQNGSDSDEDDGEAFLEQSDLQHEVSSDDEGEHARCRSVTHHIRKLACFLHSQFSLRESGEAGRG